MVMQFSSSRQIYACQQSRGPPQLHKKCRKKKKNKDKKKETFLL